MNQNGRYKPAADQCTIVIVSATIAPDAHFPSSSDTDMLHIHHPPSTALGTYHFTFQHKESNSNQLTLRG